GCRSLVHARGPPDVSAWFPDLRGAEAGGHLHRRAAGPVRSPGRVPREWCRRALRRGGGLSLASVQWLASFLGRPCHAGDGLGLRLVRHRMEPPPAPRRPRIRWEWFHRSPRPRAPVARAQQRAVRARAHGWHAAREPREGRRQPPAAGALLERVRERPYPRRPTGG